MSRIPPNTRWYSLVILICLFLSPAILQGCDGLLSNEESDIIDLATTPDEKFRHKSLLDKAVKKGVANKSGSNSLGLIIAIEPQRVLDRYKILDRYRILDRYKILDRYEYSEAFNGFAISVDDLDGLSEYNAFLNMLESDPDIMWIEPDFNIETPLPAAGSATSGQMIPWSVATVGAKDSWARSGDGKGAVDVDVYVLDTGVSNDELNISNALDFRDSTLAGDAADYDGHGTHVAGIIGAIDDTDGLVGIAPGVRIHNYKVLNDDGRTDVSVVIAAVEHLIQEKRSHPSRPMVVNMSLGEDIGTETYTALDHAVQTAADAGIVVIVAAGNQAINASKVTPAHARDAITVGSYDVNGVFSTFSNFGPAIDILAPGEAIISLEATRSGNGRPISMTGTSMATPHVAGAAALYLAHNPYATPGQVLDALLADAKDYVVGTPSSTTNKSVWVGNASAEMFTVAINNAADDAEQSTINGVFFNQSPDLELSDDPQNTGNGQMVGLRYNGINIPQGATITNAYIQFTADRNSASNSSLVIKGEASPSASYFAYTSYSLTNRPLTNASVNWSPGEWDNRSDRGIAQRTSDIAEIVQEIVDQQAWNAGNSLAIMLTGSGSHAAVSYDANPAQAPVLHIEWLNTGFAPVTPVAGNGNSAAVAISSPSDDAEESPSRGNMYLDYNEIYLGNGNSSWDTGLRFTGLNIPKGATITGAYIQMTTYAASSMYTNLTITGLDADNASTFSNIRRNISSRSVTSASANWIPDAWYTQGEAGPAQRTPDLSAIVQEIVSRPGWSSNNALAFKISGNGWRNFAAYENGPQSAAVLHVTWQ